MRDVRNGIAPALRAPCRLAHLGLDRVEQRLREIARKVAGDEHQTAAAIVNGAVARRISSPRYRSTSSIGTAANPNVTTAEPSATARTSVAASEFCCKASDQATTAEAATTTAPPATAR